MANAEYEPIDPYDRVAFKHIICPYCNAQPGHWCETDSGNTAAFIHVLRLEGVRAATGIRTEEKV